MREKAKERARLSFDYRRHSAEIGNFMQQAIHGYKGGRQD
jgi:hypothetical protein